MIVAAYWRDLLILAAGAPTALFEAVGQLGDRRISEDILPELTQIRDALAVVTMGVPETTFYALPHASRFHTGSTRSGPP